VKQLTDILFPKETIYLVSLGADIHTGNDAALRLASKNKRLEIVKYLSEL